MDLAIFNVIHNLAGKNTVLDFLGIFFASYFGYFVVAAFLILLFTPLSKMRRREKVSALDQYAITSGWRMKEPFFRVQNIFFAALSLLLASGVIATTLHTFIAKLRPYAVLNFEPLISPVRSPAFPSGHATFYFALAAIVWMAVNRRWGIWFFVSATLIALARVYVGVHWPVDILAGAAIGIISPLLVRLVLSFDIRRQAVKEEPPSSL